MNLNIAPFLTVYLLKTALPFLLIIVPVVGVGGAITSRMKGISIFERFSIAAGMGFVVFTFVAFALSVFDIFTGTAIFTILILSVIIFIPRFYSLSKKLLTETKDIFKTLSIIDAVFLCVVLLLLLYPLLNLLMPPIAWDSLVYHLQIPKVYLQEGGFTRMPLHFHSDMPLNINMLYMIGLSVGDDRLPRLLHFAMGIMLLLAMFGFVKRHYSLRASIFSLILFLMSPIVLYEFGIAYVDIAMALFLLLTYISLTEWLRDRKRLWLVLAGVFSGYLLGIKLTGGFYIFMLFSLVLVRTVILERHRIKSTAKEICLIGLVALCVISPWFVKAWYYTGNPVYPMLHGVFGGGYLNERTAEQLFYWQWNLGMGRRAIDYIISPFNVFFRSGEGYQRFAGKMSPMPLLFALFALFRKPKRLMKLEIFLSSIALFCAWLLGSQQIRFLIPVIPLLCIVGGTTLGGSDEKSSKPYNIRAIIGLLFVVIFLFHSRVYILAHMAQEVSFHDIVGKATREEYIRARFKPTVCFRKLEELTSERETVLFLFENRGYYLNRRCIHDSALEGSYFVDLAYISETSEEFIQGILEFDVRYILLNKTSMGYIKLGIERDLIFRNREINERYLKGLSKMLEFVNDTCEEIFTSKNIFIYKIKER